MMEEKDKHLLTRVESRISFLYVEMARIEQTEYGVEIVQGKKHSEIPITTINCLLLGSGVSITHKAVCNIAQAGCTVCFVGRDINTFYAYGEPSTRSSKNILKQIKLHENKQLHLDVVHKMYQIRYPDKKLKTKSVEELRGIEGVSVKETYTKCAEKFEVSWSGRTYNPGDFYDQDTVNMYITALNHVLYSVVTSAIVSLGFHTAVGFIHTGHMNSLVFDIADLYKENITIPLAFELALSGAYDRHKMLTKFRDTIVQEKFMKKLVSDILYIFSTDSDSDTSIEVELQLWGDKNFGIFGKNYSEVT